MSESPKTIPTMLRYSTHVDNNSLYNTPPSFSVYMVNEVLKWIEEQGGLAGIEQKIRKKRNCSITQLTLPAISTVVVWNQKIVP